MSRAGLRQIITRRPEAHALVSAIVQAIGGPVAIEDADGHLLHGEHAAGAIGERFAVRHNGTSLGWVTGSARAHAVAALLEHLADREAERKALGGEVLHLYREINLIYSFSEKLAALLDLEAVARLTLQETRHLIPATDGAILLLDDETGTLASVASFGEEVAKLNDPGRGQGIIGSVAAAGVGEIVNDVEHDPRLVAGSTSLKALIAAPMKVGERVIGLIALGSTSPTTYTAAERKLLNTLALQTATAIENARLFERTIEAARERERLLALQQETELARARLESEMTLAARIQANLFPSELPQPAGYRLAARNRPARRCGGDYYDALMRPGLDSNERLLLCVADVSGKGLPAALLMSNMQATLRALLGRIDLLPVLAGHASDLLYAATSPEKYVTAALAEVEPATGRIHFVGAGHLDNIVLRAGGGIVALASTGAPFGLLPPGLLYEETSEVLSPGDALVLYSDGVTDAQDSAGEEFGESRLRETLRAVAGQSPEAIIDRVFDAVEIFVAGTPQFDDMTLLAVQRL